MKEMTGAGLWVTAFDSDLAENCYELCAGIEREMLKSGAISSDPADFADVICFCNPF